MAKENNYLFITFVEDGTILKEYEKSSLIKLPNGYTTFIPKVFIKVSKKGQQYIVLPNDFKAKICYFDYNKETKVRTLKDSKEVSAKELNELFKLPF